MQLLKTDNYEIFKKNYFNRDIDKENLKRIMASIQANNMLEFRPLLVNDRMEVLDGQHRLEAAKRLGLSVYYQISENAASEDIILLNANQKSWDLDDYITYHRSKGNIQYELLFQYLKKNKMNVGAFVRLLSQDGGSMRRNIRIGTFKFPETDRVEEMERLLSHARAVIDEIKNSYIGESLKLSHSLKMLAALMNLQRHPEYKPFVMLEKISGRVDKFRRCSDVAGYMDMFRTMYNFRNPNPLD